MYYEVIAIPEVSYLACIVRHTEAAKIFNLPSLRYCDASATQSAYGNLKLGRHTL